MARLRKFVAYRALDRPNTRRSKYRKKSFVKSNPSCKVVKFNIGNLRKDFPVKVHLVSKSDLQIRDNALEAARQTATRALEKVLGKTGFNLQVRVYPHHVLRENPLASGAGADRFSTGMAKSFGKPVGIAAQIKTGQKIFTVGVDKENLATAQKAMKRAYYKLPTACRVIVEDPEEDAKVAARAAAKAIAKE
jgi:large subunit ribosomal protein L10e